MPSARARSTSSAELGAHAHDTERLAADLHAVARRPGGVAGAQRGVRAAQVARDRQHQGQRVLGLGDVAGVRRVDHDDAAPGGLGDVDPARRPRRPWRRPSESAPAARTAAVTGVPGPTTSASQPGMRRSTSASSQPAPASTASPAPRRCSTTSGARSSRTITLFLSLILRPLAKEGRSPRDRSNRASLPDVTARPRSSGGTACKARPRRGRSSTVSAPAHGAPGRRTRTRSGNHSLYLNERRDRDGLQGCIHHAGARRRRPRSGDSVLP